MKTFFRIAAVATVLTASGAAHATAYDFSYTFRDNKVIVGSFDGDATGNLITNIKNVVANYDGDIEKYKFYENGYANQADQGDPHPSISIDGHVNSFTFLTPNPFFSTYFMSRPGSAYATSEFSTSNDFYQIDYSTWHVTPSVVAVPEPETFAMLLAGLGAMSFVARRRKVAVISSEIQATVSVI